MLTPTFKASTPEKASRRGPQAFADAYLNYRQSQFDKAKNATLASIDAEIASLTAATRHHDRPARGGAGNSTAASRRTRSARSMSSCPRSVRRRTIVGMWMRSTRARAT